jgi:hypothetical protein
MPKTDSLLDDMRRNPAGVRFEDACKVATHFFGAPRQDGTSHKVWKMPWPGDPRVNLQRAKDGKAKAYQVRQLLKAIETKREAPKEEERPQEAKKEVPRAEEFRGEKPKQRAKRR